jgi:hypothetical protein
MDVNSVAILEQLSRTGSSSWNNYLAFTIDPVQSHEDYTTQQNMATHGRSYSIHPYERYGAQKYALQSYICTNLPLKLTDMDVRENNKYEQPSAAILDVEMRNSTGSRETVGISRRTTQNKNNET